MWHYICHPCEALHVARFLFANGKYSNQAYIQSHFFKKMKHLGLRPEYIDENLF